MGSKKIGVFTGFLFLIILFLGVVSAESCWVQSGACPGGDNYTIMKLSDATNAHGELWSQISYNYFLCCDFQRTHTCDGINKIVGLSAVTNAHGEIPSLINYGTDVCYGNFECRGTTGTCNLDEMPVLSLSADTNAHVGGFSDYSIKICCAGVCEGGYEYVDGNCELIQVAYWADIDGKFIDNAYVKIGYTTLLLVLENAKLSEGTIVSFDIYEDDILFDDLIKTITGTIDAEGKAIVEWTVTQEDLDKTADYDDFYFEVIGTTPSESSGDLNITIIECGGINYCRDYTTNGTCEVDVCTVAEASVQANGYPDLICGAVTLDEDGCEVWSDCECSWVDEGCGPLKIDAVEPDCPIGSGNPSIIGSCFFSENTNDDCNDGFLTYSWNGIWTWDIDNIFSSNPDGDDYIEDPVGVWHYDRARVSSACGDSSNSIACPAQIQLPFFTLETLFATIIILGVIYWAWNFKQRKTSKKRKGKKRK